MLNHVLAENPTNQQVMRTNRKTYKRKHKFTSYQCFKNRTKDQTIETSRSHGLISSKVVEPYDK